MLYTIKQLKKVFEMMLSNTLLSSNKSEAYQAVDEANKSDSSISKKELDELKVKYESKDLAKALDSYSRDFWIAANKEVSDAIYDLIAEHKNKVEKVTSKTIENKSELKLETKDIVKKYRINKWWENIFKYW